MVIKKPYAFLIKHFRLIHGLLFVLLVYLAVRSVSIYTFFNNYAVNHTYLNQYNLASNYVTPLMYILCVIAILVFFVIYFILSIKDKSNRLYLGGILYYIVLMIFFIYIYSVFNGLEETSLDIETVRLYRDVALIVVLPQLVFIFIIFGRTLGFNLKQFEFKKDLEELEIDVSDNEEVEVTLGNDTYKIARTIRKFLRLTKYFLVENKLFVITMSSLFIFAISIFVYTRINVYKDAHNTNDNIVAKSFLYNIKDSYITDTDLNNIVIKDKKSYVIVNLSVKNQSSSDYNLTRDTFKLKVKNDVIIPTYGLSNKFYDLGSYFEQGIIKGEETKEFIVAFEIDNDNISKEFIFKIKNLTYDKKGNNSFYEDVIIKPTNINSSIDKGTFQLPAKIDFKDSILGNTTLEIEMSDIAESFKEPYKFTINNEIKKGIYSVTPSEKNNGEAALVKFKSKLTLDDSIYVSKVIKEPADLYGMYGIIKYRYLGEYKTVKLNKVDVDYDRLTYSYLEIPKEATESTKVDLIILVRGVKYTINLK